MWKTRCGIGVFSAAIGILALAPSAASPRVDVAGHNGPIVFTSNRDGNPELYTMLSAGSAQTRLTNNSVDDGGPDWSVEGVIAYERDSGDRTDIWELHPASRAKKQLTDAAAGERNVDPSWDPAGGEIAYTSNRSGNDEIYVLSILAARDVQITKNSANDSQPAWSPDGRKIAFVSDRTGTPDIWVMDSDGGRAVDITPTPDRESSPAWSPDSRKLAFTRTQNGNADVWTMNASGGNAQNLTALDPGQDVDPTWSPDGRSIAYATDGGGNLEIYVMFSDATYKRDFSNSSGSDTEPSWETVYSSSSTTHGTPIVFSPKTGGCTLQGTAGPDRLIGRANPEIVCGRGGPDYIDGGGGNDILLGGGGNDIIKANDGQHDDVDGGPGHDIAYVDSGDTVHSVEEVKTQQ